MNPTDALSLEQVAACGVMGVSLSDLDAEFWNRVKRIETDALIRNVQELQQLDAPAAAKLSSDVSAALVAAKT